MEEVDDEIVELDPSELDASSEEEDFSEDSELLLPSS
jgi:hypothetical protein